MASFSVCLMAREPAEVIRRFVSYYHGIGAERIFVYLDGVPEAGEASEIEEVAAKPYVSLSFCDEVFWSDALGAQERFLTTKLSHIFRTCIAHNGSDWLLFCDADEFLATDRSVSEILDLVPPSVPGIRIHNTEAIWGPEDNIHGLFDCGYERRGFSRWGKFFLSPLTYGRAWIALKRGTSGHVEGKHMLRRGVEPEKMGSHFSTVNGAPVPYLHELKPELSETRIVHYDAMGYERWLSKWLMRINRTTVSNTMSKSRLHLLREIQASVDNGTSEQAFRRYNALNRWQLFVLKVLGLVKPLDKSKAP